MAVLYIEVMLLKRRKICNGSLHRNEEHKYIILKLEEAVGIKQYFPVPALADETRLS